MLAPRRLRRAWLFGPMTCSFVALGLVAAAVGACTTDDEAATSGAAEAGGSEASARRDGASADDSSSSATDAGDAGDAGDARDAGDAADARDARSDDGGGIIDGPGEAGADCVFNRECNAALRCECTVAAGCGCAAGARGTGKSGIAPCTDGNECASSLCIDGPPDSGMFCSDECDASTDCTGTLPICADIAMVGRICIRTPPG